MLLLLLDPESPGSFLRSFDSGESLPSRVGCGVGRRFGFLPQQLQPGPAGSGPIMPLSTVMSTPLTHHFPWRLEQNEPHIHTHAFLNQDEPSMPWFTLQSRTNQR